MSNASDHHSTPLRCERRQRRRGWDRAWYFRRNDFGWCPRDWQICWRPLSRDRKISRPDLDFSAGKLQISVSPADVLLDSPGPCHDAVLGSRARRRGTAAEVSAAWGEKRKGLSRDASEARTLRSSLRA